MDPFKYFALRLNYQQRNSNGFGCISACTSYFADVCLNKAIINIIYDAHKVDSEIPAKARQLIAKLTKRVHTTIETNPAFATVRRICEETDTQNDFEQWVCGVGDAVVEMRNMFLHDLEVFSSTVQIPNDLLFKEAVEQLVYSKLKEACNCESCRWLGRRYPLVRAIAQQRN